MPQPLVLIPARLASHRLPGKPLADIHGSPMIVHVWRRAMEAAIGPVVVAAGDPEIVAAVEAAGGTALLTRTDHPSGSDRVREAADRYDPQRHHEIVLNLQGDLPAIAPDALSACLAPLCEPAADIATLAAKIHDAAEKNDADIVKLIGSSLPSGHLRALYFSRAAAPWGEGPLYHHVGIYAYRRDALDRFVALAPSPLEKREKLEQLRAIEAGMRIDAAMISSCPLGVDTPETLEKARAILRPK